MKRGYEESWYGNVEEEGRRIGVQVGEMYVKGVSKSELKKKVKTNVRSVQQMAEKLKNKKMRFLKRKGMDNYLQEVFNQEARMAMMIRLNMIEWIDDNYGGIRTCTICGNDITTEHVLQCGEETAMVRV